MYFPLSVYMSTSSCFPSFIGGLPSAVCSSCFTDWLQNEFESVLGVFCLSVCFLFFEFQLYSRSGARPAKCLIHTVMHCINSFRSEKKEKFDTL